MYTILDSNLEVDAKGFDNIETAVTFVLEELPHEDSVWFIQNGEGDIICLVYAGNVWKPVEINQ